MPNGSCWWRTTSRPPMTGGRRVCLLPVAAVPVHSHRRLSLTRARRRHVRRPAGIRASTKHRGVAEYLLRRDTTAAICCSPPRTAASVFGPPVRVGSRRRRGGHAGREARSCSPGATAYRRPGGEHSRPTHLPLPAPRPPSRQRRAARRRDRQLQERRAGRQRRFGSDDTTTSNTPPPARTSTPRVVPARWRATATSTSSGCRATLCSPGRRPGRRTLIRRFFNGTSFGAAHDVPRLRGPHVGVVDHDGPRSRGGEHLFIEANYISPTTTCRRHPPRPAHTGHGGPFWATRSTTTLRRPPRRYGQWSGAGWGRKPSVIPVSPRSGCSSSSRSRASRRVTDGRAGQGVTKSTAARSTLQIERRDAGSTSGRRTSRSSGAFPFRIKGKSVGKHKYRAVAADRAGYVQFGYSVGRSLKVKK